MDSKRLKYMAVSRSSFCLIRLGKASIKNLLVADVSAKGGGPGVVGGGVDWWVLWVWFFVGLSGV